MISKSARLIFDTVGIEPEEIWNNVDKFKRSVAQLKPAAGRRWVHDSEMHYFSFYLQIYSGNPTRKQQVLLKLLQETEGTFTKYEILAKVAERHNANMVKEQKAYESDPALTALRAIGILIYVEKDTAERHLFRVDKDKLQRFFPKVDKMVDTYGALPKARNTRAKKNTMIKAGIKLLKKATRSRSAEEMWKKVDVETIKGLSRSDFIDKGVDFHPNYLGKVKSKLIKRLEEKQKILLRQPR